MTFMNDVLNLDTVAQLKELLGEAFAGLVETYGTNGAKYVAAMKAGLVNGDAQAIVDAAHPFKSSSGNLGAEMLSSLSADIEARGKAIVKGEADDLPALKPMIAEVSDLFDKSLNLLNAQI